MAPKTTGKGWTAERRKAQAERCRRTKPWTKATGPKTPEGKARSAMNAWKHGARCRLYDDVRYILWLNRMFLKLAKGTLTEFEANELKDRMKKCK